MAEAGPPTKKAKTEEQPAAEAEAEEKEAPKKSAKSEPPKELETDAPEDKSPRIKDQVGFLVKDTTLNVQDSMFGNMLTCLSDSGFQYLLAGARASVGMKSGRYMFEVNVVELMNQKQDAAAVAGRVPQPRNFFRLGLSTAGSSLLIGEDADSVCFDAEGSFIHNRKKVACGAKFERSMTVCLLVNLDPKSPNANTVSIFKDGERICQPQALPESLHGKALYPTITYRNVTVHYNFAMAHSPLPFTCRMLQDAAVKDVIVAKDDAPKDGKYTAVFPCCLPDEGTFQWLNAWLNDNPDYTELSDRAILDWAQRSGIARQKPYTSMSCRDKPEMGFGLPQLDDKGVQKMIETLVSMQKRNFVIMEVDANLKKDDRAKLLAKLGDFKKVALVVCGEPPAAFKKMTQDAVLKDKQAASDADFNKKLAEEKKKKALEKQKKQLVKKKKKDEKAAKKAAEERKKKLAETMKKRLADAEEKKKKAEEEKKKAEKEAAGEAAGEDAKEEDVKMEEEPKEEAKEEEEVKEEAKEEAASEESEEEPMEVEEADPEPPKVQLTDEEKKLRFKPSTIADVTASTLNTSFTKYSLPDKSEGFDEVKYEWQNATKSAEHISAWRQEKKVTARVEDLVVGEWFNERQKEWSKFLQSCKQKQNDYKAALSKRAAAKVTKEKMKQMKAMQAKAKAAQEKAAKEKAEKAAIEKAEKKAAEKEAKAKARAEKEAAGEAVEEEEEEQEEAEAAKPMEVEETKADEVESEEEEEEETVELDNLDVFSVEDIFGIGGKPISQPLFTEFGFEDWAMMSLRFELNLLVHAFKKDVKDPERACIHEDNVSYYYQKYFKKGLNPSFFGAKSMRDLLRFLCDTMMISDKKILETFLPAEFETHNIFVLLAEESRRDRQRRTDLGEEDAKIIMQTAALSGMVASGMGVSPGQMNSINAFQAAAAQRTGFVGAGVTVRPQGPMGGLPRPAMVRPPMQSWGQPQQQWRPQMAASPWAAHARPASPWGAPQGMRPYGGMVRPAGMMPAWR